MGRLGSGHRLVDRIGSGVRVSVSFQKKLPAGFCPTMSYGSRKRGYDQGGCVRGVWPPLRRITSSPSQTLRRRLVRTTDDGCRGDLVLDARRRPSRLCFSQFATRTVDNTVDMYAMKPDIRPESRFCLPHLHSTPPLGGGGSRRNIATPFGMEKLEWCDYPMMKKFRRYIYSFWHDPRTWQTDGRTHRHRMTA